MVQFRLALKITGKQELHFLLKVRNEREDVRQRQVSPPLLFLFLQIISVHNVAWTTWEDFLWRHILCSIYDELHCAEPLRCHATYKTAAAQTKDALL